MNINDYGIVPNTGNLPGIPARITAVHKERYEIVCQHGTTHAKLKTKEYFVDAQDFPTAGDFVMVNYIETGELDISRWESYRKLKVEAVYKVEMLRRKSEWSKGVAKFTRQRNKEIW